MFTDFDGTSFNSTELWRATTVEIAGLFPDLSVADVDNWNTRYKNEQQMSDDDLTVQALGGFCIYEAMEQELGLSDNEVEAAMAEVGVVLAQRAQEFVFGDAVRFYKEHTSRDNPGYIVTHGQNRMQRFKWDVLKDEFPKPMKLLPTLKPKHKVITPLRNEEQPAVYIDDRWKGFSVPLISKLGGTGVMLFHLHRNEEVNKYYHEQPTTPQQMESVIEISTFDDIERAVAELDIAA